jgi:hypothetical protein
MIVKISRSGSSFKGLSQYLTHDVGADTSKRVAWTHTLNCANDDVRSAVDEMIWTYRGADLLKEEAGIRAGGRSVEDAAKHASLNWHPSESPTREHMIATAEGFVEHMGWSEHEAILVAHQDKDHRHVHIMLNRVSPVDGTVLDEGFEFRRAQEWAKQYELEQGRVFCTQRLLPEEERTPSPTRASWEALRESEQQHENDENIRRKFDRDYFAREGNSKIIEGEEWNILKAHQREEREAFFAEGKEIFGAARKQVYRDTREQFRSEWASYYSAKRDGVGASELDERKADILERQNSVLDYFRDQAIQRLREERDVEYRAILDAQKETRAELRDRQGEGLRSPHLLDHVAEKESAAGADEETLAWARATAHEPFVQPVHAGPEMFRLAAAEICAPEDSRGREFVEREDEGGSVTYGGDPHFLTNAENPRVRDSANAAADIGGGLIGGLANIGEKLFDGFLGGDAPRQAAPEIHRPAPPPQREHWEKVRDNPFLRVAEAARQEAIRHDEEMRNRAYWDDRDRERGRE